MDHTCTNGHKDEGLTHAKLLRAKKKLENIGTTRLGRWVNAREVKKMCLDNATYGAGFSRDIERRWFNPMRWILGWRKIKRVHPKNVSQDIGEILKGGE